MRDHVKRGLRQVYQPPTPRKKQEFLAQFTQPELSTTQFLFTQAAYLRPWSWLLSVGIFVAAVFITQNLEPWDVWIVSALLPFAALTTVTELSRSARYHMEELEMSARFSLKSLLMARMTLLGLGNLVLLAVLLPMVVVWSELPVAVTGCVLLCPYCLTSVACLMLSRRFRGSEVVFVCAGVAATVSWGCFWWRESPLILLESTNVAGWAGITLILLALMLWEGRRYVCDREEWIWN